MTHSNNIHAPTSVRKNQIGLAGGLTLVMVMAIIAVSLGSVSVSFMSVLSSISSHLGISSAIVAINDPTDTIIWEIRIPRVLAALIIGHSLAVAGSCYQGLFRNPLADPYLIGVAAGSGLGATIIITQGLPYTILGVPTLPMAAFGGGLLTVTCAYLISHHSSSGSMSLLILAGIGIGSFAGAVAYFLMVRAEPDIKPIIFWMLGGLGSMTWSSIKVLSILTVISSLPLFSQRRTLNILQYGDEVAVSLGVNLKSSKLILIIFSTLLTSSVVALSGLIGFVGLIAPHITRLLWGPDHRFLLPMSGVIGALMLVTADLVARTVIQPAEVPIGIVTAFVGGPFLALILFRRETRVE